MCIRDRHRRERLFDLVPVVIDEGLDLPPGRAGHDGVAHPQGATLDHDRGHRPATGFEVGLEHDPARVALGAGPVLLDLGHEHQVLQEVVDARALEGRDLDDDGVACLLYTSRCV